MASKLQDLINRLCPNGVEYRRLGDCVTKITDGMHNLPKEISSNGEFPIISAQNVNNGLIDISTTKFVPRSVFEIENRRTNVSIGDVLLTIVGAVGRVAVVKEDIHGLCQRSLCVIKPVKGIVAPKFLGYVLEGVECQQYMAVNAHGAAQKGLYRDQVSKMLIPVPPLEVQSEIVQILDNFAELTAELTAELEKRKKQYEHYRRALLCGVESSELRVESSAWPMVKLGDVCDIGTGSSNTDEQLDEGLYPFFVRSQEVRWKNEYEFDEASVITSGDGVGVGKIYHYVEGKYALHQRAYRIHPTDTRLTARFLFYYMKTGFLAYINKSAFQSSVTSIRKPMLLNFPIPLPPLAEQRRIVSILDRFDRLCNDLTSGLPAEIAARKKQYAYYRDKLLELRVGS